MLSNKQMIRLYIEAQQQGFVQELRTNSCNQECEECPAALACDQLSEGDYPTFVKNYKEDILPILEREHHEKM